MGRRRERVAAKLDRGKDRATIQAGEEMQQALSGMARVAQDLVGALDHVDVALAEEGDLGRRDQMGKVDRDQVVTEHHDAQAAFLLLGEEPRQKAVLPGHADADQDVARMKFDRPSRVGQDPRPGRAGCPRMVDEGPAKRGRGDAQLARAASELDQLRRQRGGKSRHQPQRGAADRALQPMLEPAAGGTDRRR